ncbi:MAG TPA: TraR/DksA family transcriptional regulator [Methylomirabilota bacterium]|nr:TraR/DksA family transcriptional regulator [Methylomirabilota bacterium]
MNTVTASPSTRVMAEFRDRLLAARLSLARTVATTDAELETLAARESRELAEDAALGTVGELLGRLDGQARHELDEIDAAQARLEAGVFGACQTCHRAIPLARLRAMPTARQCAVCQEREEGSR